jgi:hypothetical protein
MLEVGRAGSPRRTIPYIERDRNRFQVGNPVESERDFRGEAEHRSGPKANTVPWDGEQFLSPPGMAFGFTVHPSPVQQFAFEGEHRGSWRVAVSIDWQPVAMLPALNRSGTTTQVNSDFLPRIQEIGNVRYVLKCTNALQVVVEMRCRGAHGTFTLLSHFVPGSESASALRFTLIGNTFVRGRLHIQSQTRVLRGAV